MHTPLSKALFITVLLCSLLSRQLAAQHVLDDRIDSLQKLIKKAAPDTGKVTLYMELTGNYLYRYLLMGNQPADSLAFFQTTTACQQLTGELNYVYGMGTASFRKPGCTGY